VASTEANFAPIMQQWQVQGQAGQRQTEDQNASSWNQFLQSYLQWQDQRDSTFSKQLQYANS
jgi:hypothetical protein